MSRFSHALCVSLQELKWSQLDFAQRTQLSPSQISRYARGKLNAGGAAIETIAREIPDPQRANVVAAWLRDSIPESASGLISVQPVGESGGEVPAELSSKVDHAIRYLTDMSRKHTEISDLLVDLSAALQGQG